MQLHLFMRITLKVKVRISFQRATTGIKTMDNLSGGQVIVYDNDGTELYRHSRGNVAGQVYFEDIDRTMDLDGHSDNGFDGGEGSGFCRNRCLV